MILVLDISRILSLFHAVKIGFPGSPLKVMTLTDQISEMLPMDFLGLKHRDASVSSIM